MTCSKQVHVWVGNNKPESIIFSLELLDRGSLIQIPSSYSSVFTNRNNEVFGWVEQHTRDVVGVSSTAVDFPSSSFTHSPEFNDSVVTTGDD
ncbi:hypothetical protein OGAPHI_002253 [Ogataea philodendri]|uniref:Uncharacterized protein n=1 Tax=Ogataea philodendri TaxID=1378263 RepID=A0A9P8PBM2_9ASCO|nr:uncharacterized protein OGAPHI_002253 [Ogataea philodendri]KAH3668499.1 hypothetical protein OGAPHI_002253 [Ogataea philodendri]